MPCLVVRERLDDFIDGELPPWAAVELVEHVDRCATCRTRVAEDRLLRDAVRRALRDVTMPSWLVARVSAALAFSARKPDLED